jgi:DNA-binding MarR family transcriptional regulator
MEPIERLLDQVRLLWHVMVESGERLHREEPVTLGMRAVLEFLALGGPSTVPNVARGRRVTRQHVQGLVNALISLDLVALETNPAHRRSALVRLTPEGHRVIERMRRRERRSLARIELGHAELERAARTLESVRGALEDLA